jgi:hypothetical protein
MTFFRELDELRREFRAAPGNGQTFAFWPKVDGVNARATALGSLGIEGVSLGQEYSVYKPDGSLLYGPIAINSTDVGTPTITRFDIALSTTSIPHLGTREALGEDYFIKLSWIDHAQTNVYLEVIYFDVVLWPFGQPSVSLNEMMQERPDAQDVLGRLGVRLGYTTGSDAQTNMAGIFAHDAHVELDALIRQRILEDNKEEVASYTSTNVSRRPRCTRPSLILNRERLSRVERKIALKLIYAADSTDPDDEEKSSGLYRHYAAEADKAWAAVGPLKYDNTEDLIPDEVIIDVAKVTSVRTRRVQG